jgi:outer membrane protein TolC
MRTRCRIHVVACAALVLSALPLTAQTPPDPAPPVESSPALRAGGAANTYPIDLPTALKLADANNPTVGVARARVREAVAQLDRARVAWIPNLSFGPTFFYHGGIDQNRRGDIFIVSRGNYTLGAGPTLRVDLSDALYLPLVARQGVRAANSRALAVANNIQLDVALAYLDLVELHALSAINAEIANRTEQILKSAQAGAEAGRNKTAADVNRALTELNLRREEGIILRGRTAAASARLAQLLLLDPAVQLTPFEAAVVPVILVPGDLTLEQLVKMGLRARPEVAAAQATVAASDTLLRQSKVSPLIPKVQADFIAGGLSGGRNDDFSPFMGQYNTGVALVWNLDNFGLGNAASVRGRRAGYEASQYQLQEVEALVSAQVVEAAGLSAARFVALEPAAEAVRQAQEMYRKLRDATPALLAGKGVFEALEPLTAVQALNQSRVQYLQQVVEFNRSQFRLYTALGQPAACAIDKADLKALPVPVIPPAPASKDPSPRQIPVP